MVQCHPTLKIFLQGMSYIGLFWDGKPNYASRIGFGCLTFLCLGLNYASRIEFGCLTFLRLRHKLSCLTFLSLRQKLSPYIMLTLRISKGYDKNYLSRNFIRWGDVEQLLQGIWIHQVPNIDQAVLTILEKINSLVTNMLTRKRNHRRNKWFILILSIERRSQNGWDHIKICNALLCMT